MGVCHTSTLVLFSCMVLVIWYLPRVTFDVIWSQVYAAEFLVWSDVCVLVLSTAVVVVSPSEFVSSSVAVLVLCFCLLDHSRHHVAVLRH